MNELNTPVITDVNAKLLELIVALNANTQAINIIDGRLNELEYRSSTPVDNSPILDQPFLNPECAGKVETHLASDPESVLSLEQKYELMVDHLVKPADQILMQLTVTQVDLIHMALGVSGEAGELVDAIKKYAIYGKQLDRENVIEELGDLEFYMEHIRKTLGLTRNEVLQKNIDKLSVRYHQGTYTDQQAQERLDKGHE